MSKSVLLSKSMKEATRSETHVDLGDDVLNTLWPVVQQKASSYPNMWRIVQDMYGDFQIKPTELAALSKEIPPLKASFANQTKVVMWLEVLNTLSTMGTQLDLAMFGIAD
ncbi:MAG: hypothetical protein ACPGWR_01840 [Ardenticatenaceae bacterium]